MMNSTRYRTLAKSTLAVLAVAVGIPAAMLVGAAPAQAANTANVVFTPTMDFHKIPPLPSLHVTVSDMANTGAPGTFGWCTYTSTAAGGFGGALQANGGSGIPVAPVTFFMPQGGTGYFDITPALPSGTLWHVTVSCMTGKGKNGASDPVYDQMVPF
jgi:hypothetical protein